MKNKQVIDSWNKIKPDAAADERMLSAILARSHSGNVERIKVNPMNKTIKWNRLAPIAACLVLVIALTAVVGTNNNWFRPAIYTVDLSNGDTLDFYKGNVGDGSFAFDFEHTARDLTNEETEVLLHGFSNVKAYGIFNSTDHYLVHLEGNIGEMKVILAAPNMPVTDTIIEGNKNTSDVNGIPVTAGYFVTNANSKGVKTIIYFASFELDGVSVYVEHAGNESASDDLANEIGSVIEQLIANGTPDLAAITE
ncbi:hypothetical protein FACS18949_14340 [Clostridia bacterium]|nr:hypothetical protein FACS189425_07150 [Clostridia bacterium]GHV35759.1 hypothetical protein FACS18949_14340 [Clostridia bacterium]